MKGAVILERGYNTSGLYAFVTSLFSYRSDAINKILNADLPNSEVYYVQEYIKCEFVSRLQHSKSISVNKINRFRNILFNYGWRSDVKYDIDKLLADADPRDLYRFLMVKNMNSGISIERVDPRKNIMSDIVIDAITIDDTCAEYSENILDLSLSIRTYLIKKVTENGIYSYKFKDIPYLIPIFIDASENIPIDVKEMIRFDNINDKIQKIFTWDIHSIILCDREGSGQRKIYSTLIRNDDDDWFIFSDNTIPANTKIDMSDPYTVRKISRQIKVVYYRCLSFNT